MSWLSRDVIAFCACTAVNPWLALPFMIITIFTTFKQFGIIYLLPQQQGAKTGANIHTIITYAYEKAFVTNNYGYSSAVSIICSLGGRPRFLCRRQR